MDYDLPVLVIDDATSMRRTIKKILKDFGFKNIIIAEDGREGIKFLESSLLPESKKIGLILCDWNMPKMSGMELLQTVNKNSQLKEIPFIMVTAEGRKEFILDAIKEGAAHFIVKPFTPAVLVEKITSIMGG